MQLTGVWLWGMAARELHQHGTPPVTLSTREPSSKLCQAGVFAFSRNPMCASPPSVKKHVHRKLACRVALTSRRYCVYRRGPGCTCSRHCRPGQYELRPAVREPTAAVGWGRGCACGGTATEGCELTSSSLASTHTDRLRLVMLRSLVRNIQSTRSMSGDGFSFKVIARQRV